MFRNQQTFGESLLGAFRGIKYALGERNFVIQSVVAVVAITLAFWLNLPITEKAIVIIFSALVLVVEIINTVVEKMLDEIIKEHNAKVARIKELMAAAVLIFSLAAFLMGLWIFGWAFFLR